MSRISKAAVNPTSNWVICKKPENLGIGTICLTLFYTIKQLQNKNKYCRVVHRFLCIYARSTECQRNLHITKSHSLYEIVQIYFLNIVSAITNLGIFENKKNSAVNIFEVMLTGNPICGLCKKTVFIAIVIVNNILPISGQIFFTITMTMNTFFLRIYSHDQLNDDKLKLCFIHDRLLVGVIFLLLFQIFADCRAEYNILVIV